VCRCVYVGRSVPSSTDVRVDTAQDERMEKVTATTTTTTSPPSPPPPDPHRRLARLLSILADTVRLRILCVLASGPAHVGLLAQLVGTSGANVSHHLSVMERAGLVAGVRSGKYVTYVLQQKQFNELVEELQKVMVVQV